MAPEVAGNYAYDMTFSGGRTRKEAHIHRGGAPRQNISRHGQQCWCREWRIPHIPECTHERQPLLGDLTQPGSFVSGIDALLLGRHAEHWLPCMGVCVFFTLHILVPRPEYCYSWTLHLVGGLPAGQATRARPVSQDGAGLQGGAGTEGA